MDEQFPRLEIEDLGYNVETHGQKGFNGVAILAKRPFEVVRGLPGDDADTQSRYIEAVIPTRRGVRAARLHLPAERQSARHATNTPTSSASWTGSSAMRGSCST